MTSVWEFCIKGCRETSKFLSVFQHILQKRLLFVTSVSPSVRINNFVSNRTCFGQIWYSRLFLKNLSQKLQITKSMSGTLHEDTSTVLPPYPLVQLSADCKRIRKLNKCKWFISFKTPAKRERDATRWNPAAQTRLVLDSSFFVTVLTLPRRNCLHSASSVLAVRISCSDIALFVFRKPLFIN
jgi:hypothetical protein